MGYSVLVVDDEKMPREILRDRLPWAELGVARVDVAEDGAQALELARAHRPDVVLSDVKMPRMNGLELAGAVREMYPECQFIFLSGYTDKEYLKGAIKLRAASYVEKPIDLEEVAAVLREVTAELKKSRRPDPNLVFYRGEDGDLSTPGNGEVYVYDKAQFAALGNLIRHKRKAEAMDLAAAIYRDIRRCEGTRPEVVRNIYCQIVFALLSAAESRNITAVTAQGGLPALHRRQAAHPAAAVAGPHRRDADLFPGGGEQRSGPGDPGGRVSGRPSGGQRLHRAGHGLGPGVRTYLSLQRLQKEQRAHREPEAHRAADGAGQGPAGRPLPQAV